MRWDTESKKWMSWSHISDNNCAGILYTCICAAWMWTNEPTPQHCSNCTEWVRSYGLLFIFAHNSDKLEFSTSHQTNTQPHPPGWSKNGNLTVRPPTNTHTNTHALHGAGCPTECWVAFFHKVLTRLAKEQIWSVKVQNIAVIRHFQTHTHARRYM